jgi:hypothetical protein
MEKEPDERRIARDFNRRANLPENNYQPQRRGQSAPRSGCVVTGVALAATLVLMAQKIMEVFA